MKFTKYKRKEVEDSLSPGVKCPLLAMPLPPETIVHYHWRTGSKYCGCKKTILLKRY